MRYRGREFGEAEIELIRRIIEENPQQRRAWLSRTVCEKLDWRTATGGLKDMACRVAMLAMARDGLLQLPLPQCQVSDRSAHPRPESTRHGDPGERIAGRISDLEALRLEPVAGDKESRLWNELIERYHYLGYQRLAGAQLRYFAWDGERLLGCLGFCAAAWKVRSRDSFIGWDEKLRADRLHLVVNNARFLILPWVEVPHLASKLLSMAARRLPADWVVRYGYRPLLLETFVDKARFKGTCYRAANWTSVGETTGRGRYDTHSIAYGRSVKRVWVYPLDRRAKALLAQ